MTETAPDRDAETLAEAAELDLALARKIHGEAMAADDRADLVRSDAAREMAQTHRKPDPRALRYRAAELEDAVGRVIARFTEHEVGREVLFEFLHDWVWAWSPRRTSRR